MYQSVSKEASSDEQWAILFIMKVSLTFLAIYYYMYMLNICIVCDITGHHMKFIGMTALTKRYYMARTPLHSN